jgi:hypothetical protein
MGENGPEFDGLPSQVLPKMTGVDLDRLLDSVFDIGGGGRRAAAVSEGCCASMKHAAEVKPRGPARAIETEVSFQRVCPRGR